MTKEFRCTGKRLSDYFIKSGSKLLRTEFIKGRKIYIFEYDDSIDKNLDQWEIVNKRSLF